MNLLRNARPLFAVGAALALTVIAAACSDNPVEPEEHPEAASVVIRQGTTVLASATADSATGMLTVAVDDETAHLAVVFLDAEGHELEAEEDTWLKVEIADGTIVGFEQDTPGEFGGHLHGLKAGTTTALFHLMHGAYPSGHEEWTSDSVAVQITQP